MTTEFIEPGSGLRMRLGKWYVISDSGSSYSDTGFDSPEAAQAWWARDGHAVYAYSGEPYHTLLVPEYRDGQWLDSDSPQCMKADDLLDFWIREGESVEYIPRDELEARATYALLDGSEEYAKDRFALAATMIWEHMQAFGCPDPDSSFYEKQYYLDPRLADGVLREAGYVIWRSMQMHKGQPDKGWAT